MELILFFSLNLACTPYITYKCFNSLEKKKNSGKFRRKVTSQNRTGSLGKYV